MHTDRHQSDRRDAILRLLRGAPVRRQSDLVSLLRRDGFEVTQSSISRDIRELGVLQPILVRPVTGDANAFEIVAGERRWRASQRAGLHQVPVIVECLTDNKNRTAGEIYSMHSATAHSTSRNSPPSNIRPRRPPPLHFRRIPQISNGGWRRRCPSVAPGVEDLVFLGDEIGLRIDGSEHSASGCVGVGTGRTGWAGGPAARFDGSLYPTRDA